MRFVVAIRNRTPRLLLSILSLFVPVFGIVYGAPHASAQGTEVGAVVCGPASTVTLTSPTSDSVVTDAAIPIEGTVSQASQLEVRIDGAFDSVVPLSMGQTTFAASVQVAAGTHTIAVTALNVCAGPNGTASAVITYTPKPQTPSTGTGTPTTIEGVMQPGEDYNYEPVGGLTPLEQLLQPVEGFAAWLNIDTGSQTDRVGSLSVGRALTITVGMYLLVLGLAPPVLMWASTLPVIAQALPALPAAGRIRLLGRVGRVIGLLLILGAFFL